MPFTPLHLGPGLLVKGVADRHFSFMVFGFSQVAMDLEVGVRMLRGDEVIHGFTHTYAGATLVALVSLLVGRPVCQFLLRYWKPDPSSPFLNWLPAPTSIAWPAAIAGAFVGTYSHVALDSLMHADMQPLAPFSRDNALLHAIELDALHFLCVLSGVLGVVVMFIMFRARGWLDAQARVAPVGAHVQDCCREAFFEPVRDLGKAEGFELLLVKCRRCGTPWMSVFSVASGVSGVEPVTAGDAERLRALPGGAEFDALVRTWTERNL